MLTLVTGATRAIDGFLRYTAYELYTGEDMPMSYADWFRFAITENNVSLGRIDALNWVYYPDTNSWGAANAHYRAVQLVCSPHFQPHEATLQMECTLRNESTYTLRYKATGYRVDENPEITHNGETKRLIEWGEVLGVCTSTMQQRYAKMQRHGETIAWLLRPKYTHGKLCGEQA